MTENRLQLLNRKRDLFAALRLLEQDWRDGSVDEEAYRVTRHRYEMEAAEILQRLDELPPEPAPREIASRAEAHTAGRNRLAMMIGATGAVIVAAIGLFLVSALHPRSGTQTVTGNGGQAAAAPTAQASPALIAAEREVVAHPRSVDALVSLGNAYLNDGQSSLADRSYLKAIRLAPHRPEARTLHAMMLASAGEYARALALIRQVERDHPAYARAWLMDGLLSAHARATYPRAIAAWQRFLALQPHSSVSAQIRQSIQRLKKAEQAKR